MGFRLIDSTFGGGVGSTLNMKTSRHPTPVPSTVVATPPSSVDMSNVSSSDIGVPPDVDLSASRGPYLLWVSVGVIIVSTLAVALRFASRKIAGLLLLLDDWTILIALVGYRISCCVSRAVADRLESLVH